MTLRDGTWGELEVGCYIADPAGKPYMVKDQRDGWTLLVDAQGVETPVAPQPSSMAVKIYVLDEHEAIALVTEHLGAQVLYRMELLGSQPGRAATIAAPIDATAQELATHINLMHGGWAIKGAKKADMADLVALHDSLHADPTHIMSVAHHHDPDFYRRY